MWDELAHLYSRFQFGTENELLSCAAVEAAELPTTNLRRAILGRGGLSRPPLPAPDFFFFFLVSALTRMSLEGPALTAGMTAQLYGASRLPSLNSGSLGFACHINGPLRNQLRTHLVVSTIGIIEDSCRLIIRSIWRSIWYHSAVFLADRTFSKTGTYLRRMETSCWSTAVALFM